MRYAPLACLLLTLPLAAGACGPTLSARNARSQIASLGGSSLVPADVVVDRIVTQTANRMIAETTLKMAFEFEREADGQWKIVAARLGDRQWVDIPTLLGAIERQRAEDTTAAMRKLAAGVDAFQSRNGGTLPEVPGDGHLSDVLHPLFMADLVRDDAWGEPIRFETVNGSYRFHSAGPDGRVGSPDDIVIGRGLD